MLQQSFQMARNAVTNYFLTTLYSYQEFQLLAHLHPEEQDRWWDYIPEEDKWLKIHDEAGIQMMGD